jgi:glycosyltransferase involved in cell wall biosynthesis
VRLGAEFAAVSNSGRDELLSTGAVPEACVQVVRNGVDLCRFRRTEAAVRQRARGALGFVDEHFVIGAVGSLSSVKRHDVLLRAFADAARGSPGIRLLVVGSGPLADELISLAGSLDIADRVVFAGYREDVPELLAATDLYTCTSDYECMSNALLEAMASQLPIIASDAPGNVERVSDGANGMVVPRGSAPDLAKAIRRLVADSDLRQRLGLAARSAAERFGFDQTAGAYQALYAAMCRPPTGRWAGSRGRTGEAAVAV